MQTAAEPVPFISGLRSLDPAEILTKLDLELQGLERVRSATKAGNRAAALRELLAYYRQRFPRAVDPPVPDSSDFERAEELVHHQFRLPPAAPVDFGPVPIDWEQNPNSEFIGPIYKFYWTPPLARAFAHTRDERYARAFVELTTDFIAQHPLEIDDDPNALKFHGFGMCWYPIQVGRRAKSLCSIFPTFVHGEAFTPEFLGMFLAHLYDHAIKAQNPSRPMWHNMAMFEQGGFADLAVTFSEFAEADQWLDFAIRLSYEKLMGQISADGAQREWSGNYHLLVLEEAARILAYASRGSYAFTNDLKEAVRRMYDYTLGMATPDLEIPAFGDSGRANAPLELRDKSSLYAPLVNASRLLGDEKYAAVARVDAASLPKRLNYSFEHAGMYTMRSEWTPQQIYLALHCSPPAMSGHDHPDNGTFELCAFGRWLMTDSGVFCYDLHPEIRAKFRQTKVHQTLTLNGENAAIDGRHLLWHDEADCTCVCVENSTYENLRHRRTVWFVDRSFFVLFDEAIGTATGNLDLHFQLCPGPTRMDHAGLSISTAFDHANILIRPGNIDRISLIEEEGMYSAKHGVSEPRAAIAYRHRSSAPASFVTALVPFRGRVQPLCEVESPFSTDVGQNRVEVRAVAFGKHWQIGRDLKNGTAWCEPL